MAQRYGFGTLEDAIVTLLTDNASDMNNGLSVSVQQVVTKKPDNIAIGISKYPSVCVWFDSADMSFRNASKRKDVIGHYEIHFWTHNKYSQDKSKDEADILATNLIYIFDSNTSLENLSSTNGYIVATRVVYDYNTADSGFITHGYINLDVVRHLN